SSSICGNEVWVKARQLASRRTPAPLQIKRARRKPFGFHGSSLARSAAVAGPRRVAWIRDVGTGILIGVFGATRPPVRLPVEEILDVRMWPLLEQAAALRGPHGNGIPHDINDRGADAGWATGP